MNHGVRTLVNINIQLKNKKYLKLMDIHLIQKNKIQKAYQYKGMLFFTIKFYLLFHIF